MNNVSFATLFASPIMQVELNLDTDKLTKFAFQMQNKDKKGRERTNIGGWQSNDITEEKHEEFIRLRKEIIQYLQIYHTEVFRRMVFKKNIIQSITNMWVNINEKYHYNEWHIHPRATLSGVYYIKHDGFHENGNIKFRNPFGLYIDSAHWPYRLIEKHNEITSSISEIKPKLNTLLIFPSWIEHKVEINLKNDSRISISFNASPCPEDGAEIQI